MTFEQSPFNLADSLSSMLNYCDMKIKEKNLVVTQFDTEIPKLYWAILFTFATDHFKFNEQCCQVYQRRKNHLCFLAKQDKEITIEFTITDTGMESIKPNSNIFLKILTNNLWKLAPVWYRSGLTIVKKLIEQQGGTIRVEIELGNRPLVSIKLC
jgi:hypothetical protein